MEGLTLVADGLTWPESPRWRDGQLWLSDVHAFRLVRVAGSVVEPGAASPGGRAGLGFMPDGRLRLATAVDRTLLWVGRDGAMTLACDVSPVARSYLNDMAVDAQGRASVGDTGFVFGSGEAERPGALLLFEEGRGVRVAADDIRFPNGIAITPDGTTLFLAETFGERITAFDVAPDGSLTRRRVHAELESAPDGLCLDADGHLWVPLLFKGEFNRVSPEGRVVERIAFPRERAIACTLGGADRRDLYLCVSEIDEADPKAPIRRGAVYRRRVEAAGAGVP